jgi:hypothetical protein
LSECPAQSIGRHGHRCGWRCGPTFRLKALPFRRILEVEKFIIRRKEMPEQSNISELVLFIVELSKDHQKAEAFRQDPQAYLAQAGISGSLRELLTSSQQEVQARVRAHIVTVTLWQNAFVTVTVTTI